MEGRLGVVEGGRAARKVRRREQRTTFHRLECPLDLRNNGLEILLCSAKRGYKHGNQLTGEPVLRLAGVARQASSLCRSCRGNAPIASVHRRPCEVDQCLSQRTEPD